MGEAVLKFEPIAKALHAAFCRAVGRTELLQLAATRIRSAGPPYTSVYMYMMNERADTLELAAFDGRETEHAKISLDKGLCGKAVTDKADLNVPDVSASPEYLACNLETRSELIVLIRRHQEILGQIDIDSDVPDGFDSAEEAAVRGVADALAALI